MRTVVILVLALLVAGVAPSAEVLFPKPLHLTRRIDDPITRKSSTVEEYCAGNRVVTVRGDRVVIADYERQEITDIDRAAATYSITRFDEVAMARAAAEPQQPKQSASAPSVTALAAPTALGTSASVSGRSIQSFEIRDDGSHTSVKVGIDHSVSLSRASLDVLLGAAYPGRPSRAHDAIVSAAGGGGSGRAIQSTAAGQADQAYGLPLEQATTYEFEGSKLTTTSVVTRVADELISPDLLLIRPGAKRVEGRLTALPRALEELDRKPDTSRH